MHTNNVIVIVRNSVLLSSCFGRNRHGFCNITPDYIQHEVWCMAKLAGNSSTDDICIAQRSLLSVMEKMLWKWSAEKIRWRQDASVDKMYLAISSSYESMASYNRSRICSSLTYEMICSYMRWHQSLNIYSWSAIGSSYI